MPLNESRTKTRERWPLEFDLEGIPRHDKAERERALALRRQEMEFKKMNQGNNFAVDYNNGDQVRDINNPPRKPYKHEEYPKMVYHHDSGRVLTVNDQAQEKTALKQGFQLKPSPGHDYAKVRSGMLAPVKPEAPEREKEMSVEELEQLEAGEQELAAEEAAEQSQAAAGEEQQEEQSADVPAEQRRNRHQRRG
jgi:hypothetical protein